GQNQGFRLRSCPPIVSGPGHIVTSRAESRHSSPKLSANCVRAGAHRHLKDEIKAFVSEVVR
ncbi:MAG: hypothetical protein RMJ19_07730, partial [Gemmatales bacterium]|nr:hypothetical protein [Gemmatales bacterium]MDW8175547.1 hypothetical protein [Gemmatales bacterium]